jgi:hypothetical protein
MSATTTPTSLESVNYLKLAALWPLHILADPVLTLGSAGSAYLVTGALPWQGDLQGGARWYAIAAVTYYIAMMVLRDEAEIKWCASHMPNWIKSALGL